MKWDVILSFTVIIFILAISEMISIKSKAKIPSVFCAAVIFMFGFWWVFPSDLVDLSTLGLPLAQLAMYLLITHMGTMLSIEELKSQWKTIIIAIAGIVGVTIAVMLIGGLFFDRELLLISIPPLTGGVVAALIMSEAAIERGFESLSILAIILYVMQGFIGYPLTSIFLEREADRVLSLHKNGELTLNDTDQNFEEKKKLFPEMPVEYQTISYFLFKLAFVALLAVLSESLFMGKISKYVLCLVYGALGTEIGFLEKKILNRTESFGFLMVSLMAFIFSALSKATPDMLKQILVPLIAVILIGVTGLSIVAAFVGMKLKYSKEMSISIALTALYGFPANYVLTQEIIKSKSDTENEEAILEREIMPKMLVGGFTTVTIVSVVISGIFINLL